MNRYSLTFYKTGFVSLFIALACSCGNGSADNKAKVEADSARARAIRLAHPNKQMYVDQVTKAEQDMKSSKNFDRKIANNMIKAYLDYASTFPNDKESPDYYFRAGGIAVAAGNYDQGIVCYQTVANNYPDYKYVVEALYQEAMIYDSNLPGQDEKAKVIYEQIIKDYPKHKLAEDAKVAISNLGKSDEQLIKEFEAKNKK